MGLIGGGPTFLGTTVGHAFTSDPLSVVFLALAAGSILYVVVQLIGVGLRARRNATLYAGVLTGLAAGFITGMPRSPRCSLRSDDRVAWLEGP